MRSGRGGALGLIIIIVVIGGPKPTSGEVNVQGSWAYTARDAHGEYRNANRLKHRALSPTHVPASNAGGMNRLITWTVGGALLAATAGLMIANAQQSSAPAFMAGDRPVTADQVREKLESDGWPNVVVSRNGKYIEVTGSLNGEAGKMAIDSQTACRPAVDAAHHAAAHAR